MENTPITNEYAAERLAAALSIGDSEEIAKWDLCIRANNEVRIRANHAGHSIIKCKCEVCY